MEHLLGYGGTATDKIVDRESYTLMRYTESDLAPVGETVYPFSITIPQNITPSFQIGGAPLVCICALQYYLKAQFIPIEENMWLDKKHDIAKCSMVR
jgi:hypothetical protein